VIDINLRSDDSMIYLDIGDDGCGIEKAHLNPFLILL